MTGRGNCRNCASLISCSPSAVLPRASTNDIQRAMLRALQAMPPAAATTGPARVPVVCSSPSIRRCGIAIMLRALQADTAGRATTGPARVAGGLQGFRRPSAGAGLASR
ncbi:MAG: hypothetical protein U5K76_15905 [Woeseiaceae bacterium]|nr:hypothetical protein [Woeseiaceae bacterium]